MKLEILPVTGIGEVTPGADLADLIHGAADWLQDGDVLVVTSKIVSKAEGRLMSVPTTEPAREQARQQAITAETVRVVAARGPTRIVATRHGFVMAAAGVDNSNVAPSQLVLLPQDPDASARALRAAFADHFGLQVAVIISDTMGRPWRNGLTDVALGAAGIAPMLDHRGQTDRFGNPLMLTQVAVVDELAAVADLVKGKVDGVPVAVVRGLPARYLTDGDGPGVVATLVRDSSQDLFSRGTAEARADGLWAAATLPASEQPPAGPESSSVTDPAPPGVSEVTPAPGTGIGLDPPVTEVVTRVLAKLTPYLGSQLSLDDAAEPATVRCTPHRTDPAALIQLGSDVHRLRAALAAERLATNLHQPRPDTVLVSVTPM